MQHSFDLMSLNSPIHTPDTGIKVRGFLDRSTLRRFEKFTHAMREGQMPHCNRAHWPILANYPRDRSMSYFVAGVRTRNLLSKFLPPQMQFYEYFTVRLNRLLNIQARLAYCSTFGPLFAVNAAGMHDDAFSIKQYFPSQVQGWSPSKCDQVWKLVVPIHAEEDCGSIAVYRYMKTYRKSEDLIGAEIYHHFLTSGDLLMFDPRLPYEQIPGNGQCIFLECYLGQTKDNNGYILWS